MIRYYYDRKKRKRIPVKKDLFCSDIIALRKDMMLLVQVKVNRYNISSAKMLFSSLVVPKNVEKWIVVWIPRKKEPEVIKISP